MSDVGEAMPGLEAQQEGSLLESEPPSAVALVLQGKPGKPSTGVKVISFQLTPVISVLRCQKWVEHEMND